MKKILAIVLVAAIFIVGCGPKQITKAYNVLSATNAAYNPTGPILITISENWSPEKKAKVTAADHVLHDAISASWASLYSWKDGLGTQDNFEQSLRAILAALGEISQLVDNKIFQDVVLGVKTILEFYLQIKPDQAELFQKFNQELTAMASVEVAR